MKLTPIPYGRQHISEEDIRAVSEALRSDFLTQGPRIAAFEEAFASYIGCRYAVAVANGTAALHLAALALGVGPGVRALTSPITFAASANCVLYCGGEVDFCDVDPDTALMDLDALERKLESKPYGQYAGVVPVDLAGQPVDLERLKKIADKQGLWILEDACHAPGASFTDSRGVSQKSGNCNYSDAAIFSFHPVKHIATGEGGMITTNREDLYRKLLALRTHGIVRDPELLRENHGGWYYEMQDLGYNYRITDFQCALGLSQLQRADAGLARRREIAARYDAAFAGTAIRPLKVNAGALHAYHLYVVRHEKRKELYDHLRSREIYAQVHYIPVHLQPYYRDKGWAIGDFPYAEEYYAQCLSLPMYPTLTEAQQEYVIDSLKSYF